MIVTCDCGAKLKISDDKLTDTGVRIKCPKCGASHLLRKPAAAPAGQPAGQGSATPPDAEMSRITASSPLVLVAHDSFIVADMIRNVLKGAGIAVEHAIDGLAALKKATELRPRAMIMDVGLSGIYGFELCERLKGDPGTRDIKIILLSSVYGLTAYKRNPVTLYGADDYIEKHHIPDGLVPKLKRLLSSEATESPQAAPSAHETAPAARPARSSETEPPMPAPLIRYKGMEVGTPPVSAKRKSDGAPSLAAAAEPSVRPPAAEPSARPGKTVLVIPETPDVLPKVPVTLDGGRKRAAATVAQPAVLQQPAPEAAAAKAAQQVTAGERPAPRDASVRLDASFFEQEEYAAPDLPPGKAVVDPEEIEKARRFARLIVSDVALYNEEAVVKGLRNGTFFELLRDDITEGRALYEKRVPEDVRATKDYYQEAFDNFIAAKKNQR